MKIFGIGLSKTGTTSLARALEILGYRTKDNLGVVNYAAGDLSSIDSKALEENDAFTDTPIPSFYRELDARYPDSKFILTIRDTDGWLKSCRKQFTQKLADKQNEAHKQLLLDLYECTVFDEQKFKYGYENFVSGILQYFKNRPQDLLVLDIAAGDCWRKLCTFLGTPIPDIPFPKANVTQIRWMNINDIVSIAWQAGKEASRYHEGMQGTQNGLLTSGRGLFRILASILDKARYAVRGGRIGSIEKATKVAHRVILKGLKELNPKIPVISRINHAVPYSERSKWNHFWLVDPLDDDQGLLAPGAAFTIDIALIEDGKPILGVVYAPAIDTIYYAMAGKEAFKIERDEAPINIASCTKSDREPYIPRGKTELSSKMQQNSNPAPANKSLAMCLAAEGKPGINPYFADTMEWQTAGAHVVLRSAGIKLINCNTKEELAYNKELFDNDPIAIE